MDKSKLLEPTNTKKHAATIDGEKVYVREISLAERIEVESRFADGKASLAALTTCAAAVDTDGKQLMTLDDAPAFDQIHSRQTAKLARAAMALNAIGADAEEEVRKNS